MQRVVFVALSLMVLHGCAQTVGALPEKKVRHVSPYSLKALEARYKQGKL